MNECKKNLIDLFQFFDGYFNTDYRLWIIPYRYKNAILKSMLVYGFNIRKIESTKDNLLCKIVNQENGKTLHFVKFYKGRIKNKINLI